MFIVQHLLADDGVEGDVVDVELGAVGGVLERMLYLSGDQPHVAQRGASHVHDVVSRSAHTDLTLTLTLTLALTLVQLLHVSNPMVLSNTTRKKKRKGGEELS